VILDKSDQNDNLITRNIGLDLLSISMFLDKIIELL